MLSLDTKDYSKQEVMDVLHGKYGQRLIDFRFDLLNEEDKVIGDITHLVEAESSTVDMDSEAEIHRTASFRVRDTGEIDFLKHRIQPWAQVKMPTMQRSYTDYEHVVGVNLLEGNWDLTWEADSHSSYEYLLRPEIQSILSKVEIGEVITFSFDVSVEGVTDLRVYDSNGHPGVSFGSHTFNDVQGEQRLSFTKTLTTGSRNTNTWYMDIYNNNNGVKFSVSNIKIEKGNEATRWSPAPEDDPNYEENWMKKVTKLKTIPSSYIEFPLGVFLLSSPNKEYAGSTLYRNIDAYDKLLILVDDGFTARVVADEGERVTDFVVSLLRDAGITKINIEQSDKTFPTWLSWDPDTSRLEIINELLEIINYEKLYVDEHGYFVSRPYRTPNQRATEYTYETNHLSVITPGATSTEDYFNVANQFVGVVSEPDRVPLTYTYENTNEDSPTSIPRRRRTITKYIDSDSVDLETLQGEVEKIAFEDSQVASVLSFDTAIMPMHSYNDILRIRHDKLGINARFQEVSWSMPLSATGTMSHTVKEILPI